MMVWCVVVLSLILAQVCRWSWSFCRFFSLASVYCFMLYYVLNKFSLVYLPDLILGCVVDFDILRGFSWRVAFSAF